MVHHLARKASVLLGYGSVLMKQAKIVERNQAQQRHLHDPSAQTVLPIDSLLGHAVRRSVNPGRLSRSNMQLA